MSKLKIISAWFPSNSGLFALFNSVVLLLVFYLIKGYAGISMALIIVLVVTNLMYFLINHEILIEEKEE